MQEIQCDLCVIGAGSAGLSVAAGASQLGLETVLIEAERMGGDCLNTGCVPSKALLAAAKQAYLPQRDEIGGIASHQPSVDAAGVQRFVEDTIAMIAPHDSQERFEGLGVHVIREHARFESARRVVAGETAVQARSFVIASGSRASIPGIPGLDPARILTNETIFSLSTRPEHLIVIGGGPIGIELAQAHRRLGSAVTVLEMRSILPRDEPELVEIVRQRLRAEGVVVLENIDVRSVEHGEDRVSVAIEADEAERVVVGSHLLVAAGRQADVDGLGLENTGIQFDHQAIKTDRRLRTAEKHIFAIGDVAGGPQFTHVASYHAGIVLRNVAFRLPAKVDYAALPWVTYTDPELAHVGLSYAAAKERFGDRVRCLLRQFQSLDRAVAERRTEGCLKLVAQANGRILGCSIVGPGAGELIGLWGLAITRKLKLRALTDMIVAYPTYSEVSKQAASDWYTPTLFSERSRRLVRLLQKLPRFWL